MSQAESLLAPFHFDAVIADKGYDSDPLRELLAAQQVEVVIPFRRNRKQPRAYDRIRYRERNIVERFINRIKWYRRIFTRYDKLARRFMAFLHFASALIWLKRNVNEPKVQQKVSGCSRTENGDHIFCALRSYFSTARKHGLNATDAILNAFFDQPFIPDNNQA